MREPMARPGAMAALAGALMLTVACGAAPAGTTGSSASAPGGSNASASVALAPGASQLCAKPPAATSPLYAALDSDQSTWTPPASATGLSPVMFNQPGQDGWSSPGTQGGKKAIQVMPGQSSSGTPYSYSEIYFTSGGAVPGSTANVMLCLQYYDGTAGAQIALQYSGTNTAGPVNGAYDAAPELYVTKGTNKWLVGSFSMTAINFGSGDSGVGAENGQSDFRVTGENATPFWVDAAWLVVANVKGTQSMAAMPTPSATGAS